MSVSKLPPLLGFKADQLPQELIDLPRWGPWKAVWVERPNKPGKYEKPPGRGLSTRRPATWYSFAAAVKDYQANKDQFAGVGFCLTGLDDFIGIDLDHCVEGNVIAPWAQEIVDAVGSYTEISPSGHGLRILCHGKTDDFLNHDVGLEVYGGNTARFLTITGKKLHQSGKLITRPEPEVLINIGRRYAKERLVKAELIDLEIPDLLDDLLLPNLLELELPYQVRDFLEEGKLIGDRSNSLQQTGVALYAAGLDDAEVYSIMVTNEHAFEAAMGKRQQDQERAQAFIWVEQCVKAKPKGQAKILTADGFDDISEPTDAPAPATAAPADPAKPKPVRFQLTQVAEFRNRKPVEWLIKRVLPKAEVGAVYGESGAGKTFFALDLVMAVVRGVPWRGNIVKQGKVAYIVAEGAGGFAGRIDAYTGYHGGIDLATLPLHVLGAAPNLLEKADVKDLIAALKLLGPLDLIVVDTLAQVTPGANENAGEDMGRALSHCKAIHRNTGATVLLVAHAGKDISRGLRGWSGIKGALDVEISVERVGNDRQALITKLKDGAGEGTKYGFALHDVVLGQDSDGENITSCVLVEGKGVVAPAAEGVKGNRNQAVIAMVVELNAAGGGTTMDMVVNNLAARCEEPSKNDKVNFRASFKALVESGRLVMNNGLVELP